MTHTKRAQGDSSWDDGSKGNKRGKVTTGERMWGLGKPLSWEATDEN